MQPAPWLPMNCSHCTIISSERVLPALNAEAITLPNSLPLPSLQCINLSLCCLWGGGGHRNDVVDMPGNLGQARFEVLDDSSFLNIVKNQQLKTRMGTTNVRCSILS